MERPFFHRLGSFLWGGIVFLLVILAVYVSVGRLVVTNVSNWHDEILQALNARGPFVVEAERIHGEWRSFSPVLVLSGLRLGIAGSDEPPLALSQGRATVDVLNSLRTGALQLSRTVLEDLSLYGELTRSGALRLQGLGAADGEGGAALREFLLNVEAISLRNNRLVLTLPDGEVRSLDLDLTLSRSGSHRRLDAELTSTRGAQISLLAEGVGDPFRPELFAGQVYTDIRSPDLGAARALVAESSRPLWVDGALDVQLWFDWDRGASSLQARLEGRDILLLPRDEAWQLPLDTLALTAALERRGERWNLFVDDLQATRGDDALHLPPLQLQLEDNALQVRASGLQLQSLDAFAGTLEVVPETLREVLAVLRPRGDVTAMQVRVDNLAQPGAGWEVAASFSGLAVDPFKGAPGASSVDGYTRLGPGGGRVLLDSRDVTLDLPLVYSQPLQFEDLYGTLDLLWDGDGVRLDSGLLTTRGEEGTARVLFGLDIPRHPGDTGIQMDLLVGLENSHPTHRAKYIPRVLNPALSNWLDKSIGEGVIEEGAFLWRGSLKKGAGPLRTVQMAFNVSDTHLDYHADWPPVRVKEGVVMIDDTAVSVWAEQAELFQSDVRSLSVETRVNNANEVQLAVHGQVSGPAEDGLRVLNESPLAGIVGGAFADWRLDGRLDTVLDLRMNLGDARQPPRVDVATRWQGVDMTIDPGNLLLQGIDGEFGYSTRSGFSARSLSGELWGKPVTVGLSQRHRSEAAGYDPRTSSVAIALATEVDMQDLVAWLQLDLLGFARGRTAADVLLDIVPGEPPRLAIDSDLRGVSLDLPRPWKKAPAEPLPLGLELSLGAAATPLSMTLGEELRFRFDLAGGRLASGALGVNRAPPGAVDGELRVAGHASLVPVDEWLGFVETYVTGGASLPAGEPGERADPLVPPPGAVPEPGNPGLELVLDELRAESLEYRGQDLGSVGLGLAVDADLVRLSLDADWLGAGLILPRRDGPAQLDVEYLDLDALPSVGGLDAETAPGQGEGMADSARPTLELPPLNVTLANIFRSEQRLGDLAFALDSGGDAFTATDITGEIARLRLPPERPARLVWHRGREAFTEVSASLGFGDLGDTLEDLGYQRIVETGGGRVDIDLHWPGAPHEASLLAAQGALELEIGSGSFLEAPSGAEGALRVVSILNLADIVRRLSLTQMFESGIPFDKVRGEVYLHGGTVEVAYLDVEGGSSFYFSGVSDVASQTLGGELVATLPVANNLPWIAALAASLPVAAGVFVVSQVFNKQVDRLSSAVYSIGGTWDDPEVEFDRIFDNTRKGGDAARAVGGVNFEARERLPQAKARPGVAGQPDSP